MAIRKDPVVGVVTCLALLIATVGASTKNQIIDSGVQVQIPYNTDVGPGTMEALPFADYRLVSFNASAIANDLNGWMDIAQLNRRISDNCTLKTSLYNVGT